MKSIRVLLSAVCCAAMLTSVCYADYENTETTTEQNYAVTTTAPEQTTTAAVTTTAPATSYEGWGGQVWTQLTSQTKPEEVTSKPSSLEIKVGAVKDGKFSATLEINSKEAVSNISATINYDSTKIELANTEQNREAGGNVVENFVSGQYIYNYTNAEATDFDGKFVTMNFIVIDPSMTSGVIYLKVDSFDNKAMKSIACSTQDGIISVSEAEVAAASANLKTVEIKKADFAYELKDLGFENVTDCAIKDENVVRYSDGRFATVTLGSTQAALTYSDGSIQTVILKVVDEVAETTTAAAVSSVAEKDTSTGESTVSSNGFSSSGVKTAIIVAVLLCVALIGAEYLIIFKPFSKVTTGTDSDDDDDSDEENTKSAKSEDDYESTASDDEDDSAEE